MLESSFNNTIEWEVPILFDEYETPVVPISLLPSNLQAYAMHLAKSAEVDEGMVVMGCLSVLSTICSTHYVVSPKDGWQEPVNIYTLTALPPANNKSLVLRELSQPLMLWERERFEEQKYMIASQVSKRKTEEKIIEKLRGEAAKATDNVKQAQLIQEIIDKEKNLTKPDIPIKLYANNVTPESLVDEVDNQGGKFALISDEGGLLETLSGLYTKGNANIDILLKGFDGGEVSLKRKHSELRVKSYLTIWLVVQPQVLSNMANKKVYQGVGFLDRFLYLIPRSNLGYRNHTDYIIPPQDKELYHYTIRQLLELVYNSDGIFPVTLTLSSEAKEEWRIFRHTIERELRPDGMLASCMGWGGKISGITLRIAGLIHVCEHLGNDNIISLSSMHKALKIAALLTKHVVAAFGLIGADQVTADAKELAAWMMLQEDDYITRSYVTLALRNRKIGKKDRLDKAIEELERRNFISHSSGIPTSEAKKPTTYYHINPHIRRKSYELA